MTGLRIAVPGSMHNFREGTNPKYRFDFGDEGGQIETNNLTDIDGILLRLFTKRVGGGVELSTTEVTQDKPDVVAAETAE